MECSHEWMSAHLVGNFLSIAQFKLANAAQVSQYVADCEQRNWQTVAFVSEFSFGTTSGAELKDGNHKTWSNDVNQQHYVPWNNSFKITLVVQCLVTGWMVSLSPSLVSALCNFSERVESQPYTHFYQRTGIQHIISLWFHELCLYTAPTSHLTNCNRPGVRLYNCDAALRNFGGGARSHRVPLSTWGCFEVTALVTCVIYWTMIHKCLKKKKKKKGSSYKELSFSFSVGCIWLWDNASICGNVRLKLL